MSVTDLFRRVCAALAVAILLGLASACSSGGDRFTLPSGTDQEADAFLFERGSAALAESHWLTAREYFRRLVDTYPTSRFRQDAKLGIGDTYLGERRVESDILAAGEFREFLRFYPLAERADYAQYRLALSQVRQVLSPQRDQTATREALRELQVFTSNFPNSKYLTEVIALERDARDRLSESEFLIGRHYFRTGWYPGSVSRLEALLKSDPQYTHRDSVYFFLAESYSRQLRLEEARTYYRKVVEEFAVSEYLSDSKKRLGELEVGMAATDAAKPTAPVTPSTAPAPVDAPASTPAAPVVPPAPSGTSVEPGRPAPASRPNATTTR